MKLSDLKTGERGVIVKVMGHGGFRKRIVEMGFIKGKVVDVLQNAPLQDPVKYKIMGYEVSLRRSEAEMIEIISTEEAARIEKNTTPQASIPAEILHSLAPRPFFKLILPSREFTPSVPYTLIAPRVTLLLLLMGK